MRLTFDQLTRLERQELRELWEAGTMPGPERLAGWVFRGLNTSSLARSIPLTRAGFAKGFFRDRGRYHGCNFPVSTEGGDWELDDSRPFGFFRVRPASESRGWQRFGNALLFDYGAGSGSDFRTRWQLRIPTVLRLTELAANPIRDLLVQPPDVASGLFIGRAFWTARLKITVTFFVLERWRRWLPHRPVTTAMEVVE